MATKTENERKAVPSGDLPAGVAMTRTDTKFQMQEIVLGNGETLVPESLAHFLAEGYQTQKHVKLTEGKYIRGWFVGMEDGELSARSDGIIPKVKWVYLKVSATETVRMLGAYNMISQLERVPNGAPVVIARGIDYKLPNGMPCTEYFVLWNENEAQRPAVDVAGTRVS